MPRASGTFRRQGEVAMLTLRSSMIAALALCALLLAACGGGGDDSSPESEDGVTTPRNGDNAGTGDDGDTGDDGAPGGDASDVEMCSLLSTDEIEAAVGNPVEDGRTDIGQSCVWDSDPNDTSVAVYLNFPSVPEAQQLCLEALQEDDIYTELDGFGAPAYSSYNEAAGGQSDVVVCLEQGQLQMIVTGGLDDEPDETRLRNAAEELAQLALSRM